MHIYTVIVARLYIIIIISNSAPFFFSLLHLHNHHPHHLLLPLIHTLPQTKSKINHKINNKITQRHHKTKHTHTRTHQRRQREWIGTCGRSACLDRCSSCRTWIGDRESGSALMANQRAWIEVLGSAFFSSCLDRSSSRHRAPCLDRNFRKFRIKRSENVGIERSFREDSRIESHEWRERGS